MADKILKLSGGLQVASFTNAEIPAGLENGTIFYNSDLNELQQVKDGAVQTVSATSTQTVTLLNNASNQNVTGFVVDPNNHMGFNADIAITREVPSGVEFKTNTTQEYRKILQLSDGSALLYNDDFASMNIGLIKKITANGTIDPSFVGIQFSNSDSSVPKISAVIDVTENSTNSVLAVFGRFDRYITTTNLTGYIRNSVCFIDGNTGEDITDLYTTFGGSLATGFTLSGGIATIFSATKIKHTANISVSGSPYGYLVCGNFDTFNGLPMSSKAIIVSYKKEGGYFEVPNGNFGPYAILATPENKTTASLSYEYFTPPIILPSVPWSNVSKFYYAYVQSYDTKQIYINDTNASIGGFGPGQENGLLVSTISTFMNPADVFSIETNDDGSNLFVGGYFNSPSLSRSLLKFDVVAYNNITYDSSFNPLMPEPSIPYVFKIKAYPTFILISGSNIENISPSKNYIALNYDGTVNTSATSSITNEFQFKTVYSFSEDFFLLNAVMSSDVYGYIGTALASYITKIYGCNEYTGLTPEMTIQGTSYSGGTYPGVTFSMDASGQLKYTSSNISGGSSFQMKYLLTKL